MTLPACQQEAVAFLTKLSGAPPRETHISAIFIGPDTVWKLKKAVRLPFLDFSGLEARHRFLLRELALNKPSAPAIYRDVLPIGRTPDGTLALHAPEPIDWVLRMARIADGDFLDVIAERHRFTKDLLRDLGDCVFDCHARLAPVPDWDSAASMSRIAQGNRDSARAAGLPEPRIAAWHAGIEAELARLAPVLRQRATAGCVRRCHGDLHLANLCLWNGKPVAFDALEFDEALATIDVGYDLAFLLMDLEQRVGRHAANRVLNRYVARSGDTGLLAALPLFLSQRAFIRAHVSQVSSGGHATALRLLAAAEACLRPARPVALAIGGLQGTGKSTLARALAPSLPPAPGALIVRSDEVRKRVFGLPPEARLPQDAYLPDANARTNAAVVIQAADAARCGHSVIIDSTFLDPALRDRLEQALRPAGIPFVGIWLEAPLPLLEARIAARRDDASDATIAVLRRAAARGVGPGHWAVIDTGDGADPEAALRRLLGLPGAEPPQPPAAT
jgi:aminoglycoside phosphotransferase family enzyme/predicted kinase